MGIKLFDSEWKVMDVLWRRGTDTPAREVARELEGLVGWNKNTTYTVLKKCVEKGYLRRDEPDFQCTPLITREEACQDMTNELIDKMFSGSSELFFSAFLKGKGLDEKQVGRLMKMIQESK